MRFTRTAIVMMIGLVAITAILLSRPCFAADDNSPVRLPEWITLAIRDGRVKVEFYDPVKAPRPFPGWTDFQFKLTYQYDYQVQFQPAKERRHAVVVSPKFTRVEVPVTHHVQLPRYLESTRWFERPLARHELEHVVIGSQPRLTMLGKRLIAGIARVERTVAKTADVTDDWVAKVIDEEISPRNRAIESLVGEINRSLDKQTNHGATSLEEPQVFFSNLYSKEHLDQLKFPYLSEVLELVNSREYQQAGWQPASFPLDLPEK